jgi:tetratricopeptide (TPR) repeat protein/transcriptional regulator with XRE-family HTH domain
MVTLRVLSFGDLLRRHRVAAGLTQEELAEHAHLSPRAITALERGERSAPRRATVQLLAEALGVTDDEYAELLAVARRRSATAPKSGHAGAPVADSAQSVAVPEFVGRSREVAVIEQQLSGTGPRFLMFAGEPGMGKSRLLHEAAQRARQLGWPVLESSCHRQGGQEPYTPLVGALARYLAETPPAQTRRELRGCDWLARLLPEAAGLIIPLSHTWTLPPEQERRLMFAAAARFLKNIAGPPGTLLVLDDLHWAGKDALDLLATLAHAPVDAPVCVLGAYRDTEIRSDDPLTRLVLDLTRDGLGRRVKLGPLAPVEASQLLDNLLSHSGETNQLLRDALLKRAGGVPFYLVSCAHALQLGAVSSARHARIPWDVAETVRQRISVLPVAGRELMRIAAIVGRSAPAGVLTTALALLGTSEQEALTALEAASSARLLLQADDTTYEFAHDLIRDVVIADLDPARCTALHLLVGEALERQPGEPPVDVLAYHYDHGGHPTKATVYLARAADRAWSLHAHAEAEAYYRVLIERLGIVKCQPDATQVRLKLSDILRTTARYDEALALLDEVIECYRTLGDLEGLGHATAQLGWCYAQRGTPSEGIARLQPLRTTLAARRVSPHGLAALDVALAQLYYVSGRHGEQLTAATRAVKLARAAGDQPTLVQAELRRGNALLMLGRMEEGTRVIEQTVPLAEIAGDLWSLTHALNNIGVVYETRGEFATTRSYVERASTVAERMGDPTMIAFMRCRRGKNAFYMGDWHTARVCFEAAAADVQAVGTSWMSAHLPLCLGHLYLVEGEYESGAAYLNAAIEVAGHRGNVQVLQYAQSVLAERELLAGDAGAALAHLQPLLDHAAPNAELAMALPLLAWASMLLGDEQQAGELVARADRETAKEHNLFDRLNVLRVQALLAMQQRDYGAARDLLEEALMLSAAMPFPYAEAKVLYTTGLLAMQSGLPEQAKQQWLEARAICDRLGERLYAGYIDQALAEIDRASSI